jgi:hypothetical protein
MSFLLLGEGEPFDRQGWHAERSSLSVFKEDPTSKE